MHDRGVGRFPVIRRAGACTLACTLACALALSLVACKPSATPGERRAVKPAPARIKVALQPFIGYAPIFIARDEGLFAEEGIEVEFVDIKSSGEIVTLLLRGELDMSPFAVNPGFFNAVARGGKVRAVFGASRWDPRGCTAVGLVARRADSDRMRTDASWKGITIATDPVGMESMLGYFVDRVLARRGLSLADVRTVRLAPAAMIDALRSGSVDIAQANEPWLTNSAGLADAVLIESAAEVVPDGQLSLVGFGQRLLDDAGLGRRVAAAFLKGVERYRAGGTARNVEILAKYTGLEPDLIRRMCWPSVAADGSANLESVAAFQEWAFARGMIDEVLPPDRFWDGRFLGRPSRGATAP